MTTDELATAALAKLVDVGPHAALRLTHAMGIDRKACDRTIRLLKRRGLVEARGAVWHATAAARAAFSTMHENAQDNSGTAYMVRFIMSREVVGLFIAPDVATLALMVDECTDPSSCEWRSMPFGGVIVSDPTKAVWPVPEGEEPDRLGGLAEGRLSDAWVTAVCDDIAKWLPLQPSRRR